MVTVNEPMRADTAAIDTVTVPAGTYILGDPCYAVPGEDWMPWLAAAKHRATVSDSNVVGLLAAVPSSGAWVVGFRTGYGDGVYYDTDGNEYGVDAGMIGLVPQRIARDRTPSAGGGRLVVFTEPTVCYRVANSTGTLCDLVFGSIRIATGDEAYDAAGDPDEYDDEYDDDGDTT